MNDYSENEIHHKRLTSEISTQTNNKVKITEDNNSNYDNSELLVTRELKQIKLDDKIKKSDDEENVDPDQKCPICLGAWTDSGSHRLCALRCGHMFGYKCIKRWLNSDNKLSSRCPQCKSRASIRHIRFLYTNRLSSRNYFKLRRIKRELKESCYRRLQIKKALMKQKQKTIKYKKMYKASMLAVTPDSEFCFPSWIVNLTKCLLTMNMCFIKLQKNYTNFNV